MDQTVEKMENGRPGDAALESTWEAQNAECSQAVSLGW